MKGPSFTVSETPPYSISMPTISLCYHYVGAQQHNAVSAWIWSKCQCYYNFYIVQQVLQTSLVI